MSGKVRRERKRSNRSNEKFVIKSNNYDVRFEHDPSAPSFFLRMTSKENGQLLKLNGEYVHVRPVLSDAKPRGHNTHFVLPRVREVAAVPLTETGACANLLSRHQLQMDAYKLHSMVSCFDRETHRIWAGYSVARGRNTYYLFMRQLNFNREHRLEMARKKCTIRWTR